MSSLTRWVLAHKRTVVGFWLLFTLAGFAAAGPASDAFLAFTAMAASPGTDLKMFATGLGAGILLDATVIRALIVPAVISLMGRWNWWLPSWPARLLRVEASVLTPRTATAESEA